MHSAKDDDVIGWIAVELGFRWVEYCEDVFPARGCRRRSKFERPASDRSPWAKPGEWLAPDHGVSCIEPRVVGQDEIDRRAFEAAVVATVKGPELRTYGAGELSPYGS